MGFEFLVRVRRASWMAATVTALFAAVYHSYAAGLGLAAGAAWSLANLRLLEELAVRLTGPRGGGARRAGTGGRAALALLALFGLGAVLLRLLPVAPLMIGFTLPFAVITLKAASLLLLGSRGWARVTASPWRATALVGLLALAAWLALGPLRAGAESRHAAAVAAAPAPVAAAHGAAAGGEHAAPPGPKRFDTLLGVLVKANPDRSWAHVVHQFEPVIFSLLVALLLVLLVGMAMRRPRLLPGRAQNLVETVVEKVYQQIVDILGPRYGARYTPFLGSLFVYILAMNLFGIVPLMESPTSNLSVTFALALTVFVYVQYTAVRELGFLGWLGHLAGSPRSAVEWALVPLTFPIHVIGELAKPVSLACRLFGNIFGEDMLLVGFASLGIGLMGVLHLGWLPFGLPLHFVFLFLVLLTSVVQALVFSMLSTVYFLLMLPHEHDAAHGEAAQHPVH
jgi:F-type H+-transporting ATPase subunit a